MFRSLVLRIELIFFLILSTFTTFTFLYGGQIPDHWLYISSKNSEVNLLSYYFFSFAYYLDFWVGPWPLIVSASFLLLWRVAIYKRNNLLDIFLVLPLSILVISSAELWMPGLLGFGARSIISTLGDNRILYSIWFLSAGALLSTIFRGKLFKILKRIALTCLQCVKGVISFAPLTWPHQIKEKVSTRLSSLFHILNMRAAFKLRGINPKLESVQAPIPFQILEDSSEITKKGDNKKNEKEVGILREDLPPAHIPEKNPKVFDFKDPGKNIRSPGEILKIERDYGKILSKLSQRNAEGSNNSPRDQYFDSIIEKIETKLKEFNIKGEIINVLKGPVVDTFELDLGPGVKVSRITSAAEDLGLALMGAPIRIVYPMKGKTTVGIEVPRNPRETIFLDEIFRSKEFRDSTAALPLAMGKNAFGETFVVDLASMPHMLVAGSTGAGKSVFINALLVSLLVKKSPRNLKLILIDPKQLELALYSDLPHLSMPVITNPKEASLALLWACQEMERRYTLMKEAGVRNIEGLNRKVEGDKGDFLSLIRHHYSPEDQESENFFLPFMVIVIDEFADLILTKAGKEIENNVCRLAAKARAAGIHLVVATQRPSVDVITGLIKSNFPTRVSFRVTTGIDSRTILNTMGAEKLLGKGDMLYKHGVETSRLHSAFVEELEIEKLTQSLGRFPASFSREAIDFLENEGESELDSFSFGTYASSARQDEDDLYNEAVKIVSEIKVASASMLQRKLKIGYNRAANLIDNLEENGVIGPAQGPRPREVFGGDPRP